MSKNEIVICSPDILLSRKGFDVEETRLFYYMMIKHMSSVINENKDKYDEVIITTKELKNLFNKSYTLKELKTILDNMPRSIEVGSIDGKDVIYGEISCFDYFFISKEDMSLTFRFGHTFLKHAENIFNRFSFLSIDDLLKLKSKHSMRLYEIYCQYANQGNIRMSINDLYDFFFKADGYDYVLNERGEVIESHKTITTTNLMKTVSRALKEIESKLGVKIELIKHTNGRAIQSVSFKFKERREADKKIMFIVKQLKSAISHDNDNQQFNNEHLDKNNTVVADNSAGRFIYIDKSYR